MARKLARNSAAARAASHLDSAMDETLPNHQCDEDRRHVGGGERGYGDEPVHATAAAFDASTRRRYTSSVGSVVPFFHRVKVDWATLALRHISPIVIPDDRAKVSISPGVSNSLMGGRYVQ